MAKEAKSEVQLAAGHKECQDIVILVSKMNEANDLKSIMTKKFMIMNTIYLPFNAAHNRGVFSK